MIRRWGWAVGAAWLVDGLVLVKFPVLGVCVRLLPGVVTACSTLSPRVVPLVRLPPDAALAGFAFLCAALYKARQNLYNKM